MRLFSALLLAMLCLTSVAPYTTVSAANETVTINVYNWGQYISDGSDGYLDVNKAFTEATGIEVNYMTFDSNESMYTRLKTGGTNFDIIIPSDYMIGRLIAEDMLEELNFDNIPNYSYIDEAFLDADYDPQNLYSVPYTWGTVGLIYNTKYVTEEVTSWDLMWNEDYAGKILMFDNPRDAFAIAQFSLGQSINTEDFDELAEAADYLKEQKPVVQSYVMDQIFDSLVYEEAWIGAYYAGDFITMVEDNEDLAFCYPEEGFNMFVDAMCIPKGAENKDAAEAYINFLCNPEISGANMDYLGYSTPISAAKDYMDPEIAENPIAYPDASILENGDSFLYLSDEATLEMDDLWLAVKTDKSTVEGTSSVIYLGVGIVVALMVVMLILNSNKKKRQSARNKNK